MKRFWLFAFSLFAASLLILCGDCAETTIYENDFSDAATLADFTAYRHAWEIRDGGLYATSQKLDGDVSDAFSHILCSAAPALTDYIAEVDYLHAVTTGGLVFNADIDRADHGKNGFYGYIAFGASTGDKGAFGYATAAGAWGGNINVGSPAYADGTDLHIKVIVKGDYVSIEMTDIATGRPVYSYIYSIDKSTAQTKWHGGAVGFRLNGTEGAFDNLKITTANEVSVPSDLPAGDFGAGLTFGAHTGRYAFLRPLPKMPRTFEATLYFPYTMTSDYTHIIMSNFQRPRTGFLFEITKGGQPSLMFYDAADVRTRYTFSAVNVYNGKKTHLAITADSAAGKISCFVDGVCMQTLDLTVDLSDFSTEHAAFGTDNREINLNLFRGALISFACYADVRTPDEIAADRAAPGKDDLILHFDMTNAVYGEDIRDLSDSGADAIFESYWSEEIDHSTDYAYSIAVVGDTQHNVQYQPATFEKLYDWLRANARSEKTAFMLGLGDITNDNTDAQWACALENIAKLDGVLPYALCRGNHDGSAQSYSVKLNGTAYAAAISGKCYQSRATSYQKFKAESINYLVITLNYNPSEDELAWAKGIAEANPYDRVIVTTHSYLDATGDLSSHGQKIWEQFVKRCPNVEMVLSGHVFNDKILCTQRRGDAGNLVTQMMINGQCVDATRIYAGKEAAGLVAMFYFDETGRNLKVEYYSTALDKYFMECNQFEATVGALPGDVNFDGRVTVGDALRILCATLDGKICYNGDVDLDEKLTLTDVLHTIRRTAA